MLPTLRLDLGKLCDFAPDINRMGEPRIVGYSYAYQLDRIREAALAGDNNLDAYLSGAILRGLNEHPVRSELLFWYSPYHLARRGDLGGFVDFVMLTVCCKTREVKCSWLHALPGLFDSGRDFVPDNAQPFLYWNGKNLCRIYRLQADWDANSLFLCDLGSFVGLAVEATDEANYRRIEDNKIVYWDRSVVPSQAQEVLTVAGKRAVLLHAFWKD